MKRFKHIERNQTIDTEPSKMYPFDNQIDVAGKWWIADKPDESIHGQLQYCNNDGIKLTLTGTFSPLQGEIGVGRPTPRYPAIHGYTVKGETVTLLNAFRLNTSMFFGAGGYQQPDTVQTSLLVFGDYLTHDCKFSKMIFRVPGLEVWLGHELFKSYYSLSKEKKFTDMLFSMDLEKIPKEEFIVRSIEATLRCTYDCLHEPSNGYSFSVSMPAYFSLEPTVPKETSWFLNQQERFMKMVSFLAGRPIFTNSIRAKKEKSENWVDIVVPDPQTKFPKGGFREHNFFIPLVHISKSLDEFCNKWFEIEPKISKPAELAMSILASEGLWLHVKFLSLIQALEGLHRALYDGKYMEEKDYEDVRRNLIDSIPQVVSSDHKDALKSKIKYGNQKSLAKRLKDLAEELPEPIRIELFGGKGNIPRSWIDTRNYYTHWDDELIPKILNNQTMHYANIRMHYFILAIYAQLMGIPQEDIGKALTGSSDCAQELIRINCIC